MFYREAGQFKTTYQEDLAAFPIFQDKVGIGIWLFLAVLVIPILGAMDIGILGMEFGFAMKAIILPTLIFTLTTLGLNILVGFAGQISLGTGAFMGVGAYACYKLTTWFPDVNIIILFFGSGFVAAVVGVIFGLPSLRIKGFYLVVATLGAQFFLEWAFGRIAWLYNYNDSGAIEVPTRTLFGMPITGASADVTLQYFVVLAILIAIAGFLLARLLTGLVERWLMSLEGYLRRKAPSRLEKLDLRALRGIAAIERRHPLRVPMAYGRSASPVLGVRSDAPVDRDRAAFGHAAEVPPRRTGDRRRHGGFGPEDAPPTRFDGSGRRHSNGLKVPTATAASAAHSTAARVARNASPRAWWPPASSTARTQESIA